MKTKINIPVYGSYLTVIICKDLAEVEKEYNLDNVVDANAYSFKDNKKGYYEYFLVFKDNAFSPEIIAHECAHFVGGLFEDRGIFPDFKNDEPFCYMLSWSVRKCCEFGYKNEII